MTAILAVAARHLNILNPASRHYSDAALFLLSKSCSQFRADLDRAITVENRDTRLGTSILLHYLSWSDVEFLDSSQAGGAGDAQQPLDLSHDQLFLLSGGVRHVRFLSWQLPGIESSIFGRLIASRNCGLLRSMLENRGRGYHAMRERLEKLYDDPRFRGGIATPPPEEQREGDGSGHGHLSKLTAAIFAPCQQTCTFEHLSNVFRLWIPDGHGQTPADRPLYSRLSFEVAVDRLTLLLYASRLHEPDDSALGEVRDDVERVILSFPLLCFGPFYELVAAGDSRALAVLYLVYRSAGTLLRGPGCPWWAERRVVVMERALRGELGRRGLLAAVEDVAAKAVEDMEMGATD
ncbi:hypothetical protein IMZ48_33620 [Candidatus Bathyarchaeota archaeon]|nr:hypothetical protein [Candidatus Bathyarchaeota archaeon]